MLFMFLKAASRAPEKRGREGEGREGDGGKGGDGGREGRRGRKRERVQFAQETLSPATLINLTHGGREREGRRGRKWERVQFAKETLSPATLIKLTNTYARPPSPVHSSQMAWLTRRSGDTSTACRRTVPARPMRVESSRGPLFAIASTSTWSGFWTEGGSEGRK